MAFIKSVECGVLIKFKRIYMKRAESGFTLIELMVVMVIISALVSLVGPPMFKRVDKTKAMAEEKELQSIVETIQMTAFSRKTPIRIRLEDKVLTVLDQDGTPVDSTLEVILN